MIARTVLGVAFDLAWTVLDAGIGSDEKSLTVSYTEPSILGHLSFVLKWQPYPHRAETLFSPETLVWNCYAKVRVGREGVDRPPLLFEKKTIL